MFEQTQTTILSDYHDHYDQTGAASDCAGLDEDQVWQDYLKEKEYDIEAERSAREQEEREEEEWRREYPHCLGGSGNYESCDGQEAEEEPY